MNPKD